MINIVVAVPRTPGYKATREQLVTRVCSKAVGPRIDFAQFALSCVPPGEDPQSFSHAPCREPDPTLHRHIQTSSTHRDLHQGKSIIKRSAHGAAS